MGIFFSIGSFPWARASRGGYRPPFHDLTTDFDSSRRVESIAEVFWRLRGRRPLKTRKYALPRLQSDLSQRWMWSTSELSDTTLWPF